MPELTEIQVKLVSAVDAGGGSVGWNELIEKLSYPEKQQALVNVRVLEGYGILKRIVSRNAETGAMSFVINKVGA